MAMKIAVPRRTLLVLCGPAASGKSTFAARRFLPTAIVSSDYCRAMICDDENNQKVHRETFNLFHYIIQKRLDLGRFTVADSTALQPFARRRLLEQARHEAGDHGGAGNRAGDREGRPRAGDREGRPRAGDREGRPYISCLLIFNTSLETCMERDLLRPRSVGEAVIRYHADLLQKTLLQAPGEGWDQLYVLQEDEMDQAEVEIIE